VFTDFEIRKLSANVHEYVKLLHSVKGISVRLCLSVITLNVTLEEQTLVFLQVQYPDPDKFRRNHEIESR
jgi:hypothetical protein